MPSMRKQKTKARCSQELDMLSDLEYMDIMLGRSLFNEIESDDRNMNENSEGRDDSSMRTEIGLTKGPTRITSEIPIRKGWLLR